MNKTLLNHNDGPNCRVYGQKASKEKLAENLLLNYDPNQPMIQVRKIKTNFSTETKTRTTYSAKNKKFLNQKHHLKVEKRKFSVDRQNLSGRGHSRTGEASTRCTKTTAGSSQTFRMNTTYRKCVFTKVEISI